jgi:glucose-1-phosphate thymidylyltransferase
VTLAIIDATIEDAGLPFTVRRSSRYATPIANSPLITHVIADVTAGGASNARIITSTAHHLDLERMLPASIHGSEVSYGVVSTGNERVAVLSELAQALSSDPVLFHPGDGLFRGQISAMLDRFAAGDVAAVVPARGAGGGSADSNAQQVSYQPVLLGPETRLLVESLLASADDREDLVDALHRSDHRLAECETSGGWRYGTSTRALLEANRLILDALGPTSETEQFGENNEFHGRVSVSSQASISNCVIYGPVAIADRAVLEHTFVGPYTAVGPDTILSGAEIDNAMVLAGAEIRHPGSRIAGSIIGERACIRRAFELPKGLHVSLPAGSSITLS